MFSRRCFSASSRAALRAALPSPMLAFSASISPFSRAHIVSRSASRASTRALPAAASAMASSWRATVRLSSEISALNVLRSYSHDWFIWRAASRDFASSARSTEIISVCTRFCSRSFSAVSICTASCSRSSRTTFMIPSLARFADEVLSSSSRARAFARAFVVSNASCCCASCVRCCASVVSSWATRTRRDSPASRASSRVWRRVSMSERASARSELCRPSCSASSSRSRSMASFSPRSACSSASSASTRARCSHAESVAAASCSSSVLRLSCSAARCSMASLFSCALCAQISRSCAVASSSSVTAASALWVLSAQCSISARKTPTVSAS
eukprot:comp22333_c0_seq1/m.53685 comp22333_c0_seq1/g.53685  ORF comp22333_c0_seq1/g.53685 comp22333_c0_seq1/m.53685 type:complete len:330 (+) comp22333_c0_seq1:2114-3103(+)